MAEVVEEVTASHRSLSQPTADEAPVDLFAVDDEPAPRPVPMRTWQGGRRRRGFGELSDEPEQPDEQAVTPIHRPPLPSPVPLARRTRPAPEQRARARGGRGPAGRATAPAAARPAARPDLPARSRRGRLGERVDVGGLDGRRARRRLGRRGTSPARRATPAHGHRATRRGAGPRPGPPVVSARARHRRQRARRDAVRAPASAMSAAGAAELLKPEALARLSDADRELLARLQAELAGGRSISRWTRRMPRHRAERVGGPRSRPARTRRSRRALLRGRAGSRASHGL